MSQEVIIDSDGTKVYNGASCDTPEITSFETCGGSNIAGYQWTITAGAGTINSSTGQVIWNPNFVGTATVSVSALGCNGPSNTQAANFQIFAADPIEEHIYVSNVVVVTDVVSVTVDGLTARLYRDRATSNCCFNSSFNHITLINSNFAGISYNVTATA